MRVLLVDDELPAIEGTLTAVDWEKLGIQEIYSAFSSEEAQNICQDTPVDILICDIEMPQGSGIELLRWVKEHHADTEAIFLTAHADFKYAKQAVQLGCLDYVLKPVIPEEFEQIIEKAITRVNQKKESIQYRQYGQYWLQNKPLIVEKFWFDILTGSIPAENGAIKRAAEERSIHYLEETTALPILIKIQRWYKDFELKEEKRIESALRNHAEDSIKEIIAATLVIPVERGTLVAIVDTTGSNPEMTALSPRLDSFIADCNQSFYCDLSLYVGDSGPVSGLTAMLERLHQIDSANVTSSNKVILSERRVPSPAKVKMPDFTVWSKLMGEGLRQPLLEDIRRYKGFLEQQKGIDPQFLIQFHQDFLQMVHYVLQIKGIQAHQLFNDVRSQELSVRAARTVTDLFIWIGYLIDKSMAYMADIQSTDTVMDKIRRYVTQHIGDDLTREELANQVYLNPDYLTRIVKKETGLPISEYIQRERIQLAKELLIKTDLPISDIAMQVGYMHFSQFSKIFKKHTDVTPIEFRHQQKL